MHGNDAHSKKKKMSVSDLLSRYTLETYLISINHVTSHLVSKLMDKNKKQKQKSICITCSF